MTCVIVDDEPLAVQLLEQYVGRLNDLELQASFTNPLNALPKIKELKPDILFLDIQMPELSGMELARLIPDTSSVIFTTAYRDYAVEGFELNACDYLLKPISFARFIESVQRVESALPDRVNNANSYKDKEYMFIKHEHSHVKLNYVDVLFLKGQGDYVEVHTQERRWMTLERLKDFEKTLPSSHFIRVHKSYIVNVDKIESVERNRILMEEFLIPISPTYRERFRSRFLQE